MKNILALLVVGTCCAASMGAPSSELGLDERIERDYHPKYLEKAWGEQTSQELPARRYAWPVKLLSIGHTTGSYQNYTGSLSQAYFHHGLDIRADEGETVRASAGGKVVNIENYEPGNNAYWEVAILDDEGFIWQYHHVDKDSIPGDIKDAFKSGGKITAGTKIGEVVHWSIVAMGERYNHIHLNIIGKDKRYLSAFDFLESLPDRQSPEIVEIGILKNGNKAATNHVSGPYSLYAHVRDLILHDKFQVPPHEMVFSVDGQMPVTFWKFGELPGLASNKAFVNELYNPKLTCGSYECRRPVVDLAFRTDGKFAFPASSGTHRIQLTVKDYEGNHASKEFSWTVD